MNHSAALRPKSLLTFACLQTVLDALGVDLPSDRLKNVHAIGASTRLSDQPPQPDTTMHSAAAEPKHRQQILPRIVLVDSDGEAASRAIAMLHAAGLASIDHSNAVVVSTLAALAECDLSSIELVICAMELEDGTGIDALTYLRGAYPGLNVAITIDEPDSALVCEAISTGALDCIIRDDNWLATLPVHAAKWLAQQRHHAETLQLQRNLNHSLMELVDEVTELQSVIHKLEAVAVTDELTGLHNRRRLNLDLDQQWSSAARKSESIAFLMIDVDEFKALNDKLGHLRGDAMLCRLGEVLRNNCRKTDTIARYGGDEFCVLMPDISVAESMQTADRISKAFQNATAEFAADGAAVTLSIGIAHTDLSDPSHAMQLVAHADEAMYTAKRTGDRAMARSHIGVHPAGKLA